MQATTATSARTTAATFPRTMRRGLSAENFERLERARFALLDQDGGPESRSHDPECDRQPDEVDREELTSRDRVEATELRLDEENECPQDERRADHRSHEGRGAGGDEELLGKNGVRVDERVPCSRPEPLLPRRFHDWIHRVPPGDGAGLVTFHENSFEIGALGLDRAQRDLRPRERVHELGDGPLVTIVRDFEGGGSRSFGVEGHDGSDLRKAAEQRARVLRASEDREAEASARTDLGADLLDWSGDDDPAPLEHADCVTQLGELGQDVRREQDRLSHATERAEERAELDACARVEVARGLVEDEHLGIVKQRAREEQSLLLPLGEGRDVDRPKGTHLGEIEHPPHSARAILAAQPERAREEIEVFADGDALVDARAVRHVAEDASNTLRMGGHVVARDPRRARRRLEQRREDTQSRRLPCPVRADEAVDSILSAPESSHREEPLSSRTSGRVPRTRRRRVSSPSAGRPAASDTAR